MKRIKDLKIGLITGSTIVIQNGLISSESSQNFINLFNEAGQVIETRTANIDNGNAIIYKFKYGKCDEHDRWEWLNWRKSDGKIDTVQIQLMTFDKNCRTKTVVWLDSTGIQTDTRVFEYDNNGKKTSEIDLNIKNEKTAFILYSYADNYTIDKKAFFGDSTFWYHNREYFDKKGNQIGYDSFDENGNKTNEGEKVNFIYKDDRPIEETHYESNGQIRSKTNYLYNAEGLVERTITKSRSGDDETEIISILKYIKRY
ncbi:MAG: hypothetical protein AAFQ94_05640 [Bacteroidota bacterium]